MGLTVAERRNKTQKTGGGHLPAAGLYQRSRTYWNERV